MKSNLNIRVLTVLAVLMIVFSCKKSADSANPGRANSQTDTTTSPVSAVPFPLNPSLECNYSPGYGDSILFSEAGSANDAYVYPVNNKGVKGTYLSWPVGLDLDAQTGAINLGRSETGQRYSIGFVVDGSTDTCISKLIIGGAGYMDSIYLLSQSDKTALPYFNANTNTPNPCLGNQGPGCHFDYYNSAQHQGIIVDKKTGFIDLKKTMQNSPFGLFPYNGATVLTTIYYQLNDKSNGALQHIQVKMIYYNHQSDIPDALINTIQNRMSGILNPPVDNELPTKPPIVIITRAK